MDVETAPRVRRARFFGMPGTGSGRWSVALEGFFVALFGLWLFYVTATPIERPTFFSDPLHAVLILGAAVAGSAGAVVGAFAVLVRGERSVLVLVSVAVGLFVLYWTLAEVVGHG